jgi:hypothetical protein
MTFSDSVEFNRQRCYSIRAVRGTASERQSEGDPIAAHCFIPVDVFPPCSAARLVAVA